MSDNYAVAVQRIKPTFIGYHVDKSGAVYEINFTPISEKPVDPTYFDTIRKMEFVKQAVLAINHITSNPGIKDVETISISGNQIQYWTDDNIPKDYNMDEELNASAIDQYNQDSNREYDIDKARKPILRNVATVIQNLFYKHKPYAGTHGMSTLASGGVATSQVADSDSDAEPHVRSIALPTAYTEKTIKPSPPPSSTGRQVNPLHAPGDSAAGGPPKRARKPPATRERTILERTKREKKPPVSSPLGPIHRSARGVPSFSSRDPKTPDKALSGIGSDSSSDDEVLNKGFIDSPKPPRSHRKQKSHRNRGAHGFSLSQASQQAVPLTACSYPQRMAAKIERASSDDEGTPAGADAPLNTGVIYSDSDDD